LGLHSSSKLTARLRKRLHTQKLDWDLWFSKANG
jgi:hypothetical protein